MSDIDWGGKPVPVTRLCGWDWVPLDIAQARIAALEAALTAERERADRAEGALRELGKHPEECADDGGACVSHLAYEDCTAERDALRERVARLVGVIEAAPHGAGCLFGLKATASMFYHCNCWKRTALGDK